MLDHIFERVIVFIIFGAGAAIPCLRKEFLYSLHFQFSQGKLWQSVFSALAENDYKNEIYRRLPRYQTEIKAKTSVINAVTSARSRAELLSAISGIDACESIKGDITDIVGSAL